MTNENWRKFEKTDQFVDFILNSLGQNFYILLLTPRTKKIICDEKLTANEVFS